MKIVFFIIAIAFAIYWSFYKKENDEEDKISPKALNQFQKFLSFSFIVFIFGGIIFKEDLFLWLFLYTAILSLILISLDNKKDRIKTLSIGILIFVGVFCIFRVPTHPDSFQQWVSENKQLYCPSGFDCVKVSTYIDKNENLVTQSEIVPITVDHTNWYLIFATGSFSYEDSTGKEVHYKGINIAGWWIETTD